jgi:hypothetical protein
MKINVVRWWVVMDARMRVTAPASRTARTGPAERTAVTVRAMAQRKKQIASDS